MTTYTVPDMARTVTTEDTAPYVTDGPSMRTVTAVFRVPVDVAEAMQDKTQEMYQRRDALKDAICRGEVDLVACMAFDMPVVEGYGDDS